ncbi:MAG: 1,4-dihydroxy-2-naphthoate polyprenyltransferase [Sandaracinus sp.]
MTSAALLVRAARPQTLPAGLVPVLVGTAVAHQRGGADLLVALVALTSALFIQIGANYANDVFDAEKGADGPDRVGPVRAVAAGLVSAGAMRAAMWASFAIATALGLILVWLAGWPVIAIGVASILAAIAYTGGPYPLGYHGLGDVFVMIFFGFVAVVGTVFVETRAIDALAWLAALPVGALSTAILVVNNVRDRHTDARVGKRTLAVRLGKRGGLVEQALLFVVSYASAVATAAWLGSPWPLLPLFTVPLALTAWRALRDREGAALNEILGSTARLLLAFGTLYAIGVALA